MNKKAIISILIITAIVLIDQILKVWVKTNMTLGQDISILGDRIMLYFTENPGMAFGISFGGDTGKLVLSLLRIVAIVGLTYYLVFLLKRKAKMFIIVCLSMILAGAFGNLIDSAFYGLVFSESTFHTTAEIFPEGGGYGSFLHGKVVDMFYCPVIKTQFPEWVPIKGGDSFVFFKPIFNVADSAITVAVFMVIFRYKTVFKYLESIKSKDKHKDA